MYLGRAEAHCPTHHESFGPELALSFSLSASPPEPIHLASRTAVQRLVGAFGNRYSRIAGQVLDASRDPWQLEQPIRI